MTAGRRRGGATSPGRHVAGLVGQAGQPMGGGGAGGAGAVRWATRGLRAAQGCGRPPPAFPHASAGLPAPSLCVPLPPCRAAPRPPRCRPAASARRRAAEGGGGRRGGSSEEEVARSSAASCRHPVPPPARGPAWTGMGRAAPSRAPGAELLRRRGPPRPSLAALGLLAGLGLLLGSGTGAGRGPEGPRGRGLGLGGDRVGASPLFPPSPRVGGVRAAPCGVRGGWRRGPGSHGSPVKMFPSSLSVFVYICRFSEINWRERVSAFSQFAVPSPLFVPRICWKQQEYFLKLQGSVEGQIY